MKILLFEDHRVAALYPITTGRAAFAVTCGCSRLINQLSQLSSSLQAIVRPHMVEVAEADFPELNSVASSEENPSAIEGPLLAVNARLVPSKEARERLASIIKSAQPGIIYSGESIAAAFLPTGISGNLETSNKKTKPSQRTKSPLEKVIESLNLPTIEAKLPTIDYPHDVIRYHLDILPTHLEEKITSGDFKEIADGVFAAAGAKLSDYVVCDTKNGPIVLDSNATVGPFSLLSGPIYLGKNSRVLEHAAIKDFVTLGHTTKTGGEVEASIIEPYSNKQHHGFIGHSHLGSWVNLGAGTCNSDLKNTYGTVNMDYNGNRVNTDMQFVGAFIGDYAKSAINTGFFTGKTIGVCSMSYGFVTTNVASFVNYARLFGQVTATPVEVMISAQSRMFARRKVQQRPCDIQLLEDMYELTRYERELGSVPLEPLSL